MTENAYRQLNKERAQNTNHGSTFFIRPETDVEIDFLASASDTVFHLVLGGSFINIHLGDSRKRFQQALRDALPRLDLEGLLFAAWEQAKLECDTPDQAYENLREALDTLLHDALNPEDPNLP